MRLEVLFSKCASHQQQCRALSIMLLVRLHKANLCCQHMHATRQGKRKPCDEVTAEDARHLASSWLLSHRHSTTRYLSLSIQQRPMLIGLVATQNCRSWQQVSTCLSRIIGLCQDHHTRCNVSCRHLGAQHAGGCARAVTHTHTCSNARH
jgi:hypothetical protein